MVPRRVPVGDPIPDYYPRVVDDDLWARARGVAVKRRLGKAPNAGGRLGTVVSNLFGMVATCGSCGSAMNFRDRGPRSHTVLRCSAERSGDCDNAYRVPYQDTVNAILSWLVRLDLSGGVPGERAKIDEAIRTKVARRDSLFSEGDEVAARIGAGSRFGARAIERIEAGLATVEPEIVALKDRLAALDAAGRRDEREMAVASLLGFEEKDLTPDEAKERRFALRSRIRQVIRDSFTSMRCMPDGHVEIVTIDGRQHLFRDGYWWHEEALYWVPWAGSMFGMGYYATKAELARRRVWLDEAEKVNEPRRRAAGMIGV